MIEQKARKGEAIMRHPQVGDKYIFYNNPTIYELYKITDQAIFFKCDETYDWFMEDLYRFLKELDSGYLAKKVE